MPTAAITVVEDTNGPADPSTAQFKLNDSFYSNTNECSPGHAGRRPSVPAPATHPPVTRQRAGGSVLSRALDRLDNAP